MDFSLYLTIFDRGNLLYLAASHDWIGRAVLLREEPGSRHMLAIYEG